MTCGVILLFIDLELDSAQLSRVVEKSQQCEMSVNVGIDSVWRLLTFDGQARDVRAVNIQRFQPVSKPRMDLKLFSNIFFRLFPAVSMRSAPLFGGLCVQQGKQPVAVHLFQRADGKVPF